MTTESGTIESEPGTLQSSPLSDGIDSAPERPDGWFEAGLGRFVKACNKVEGFLARFFAPILEELRVVGRDLKTITLPATTLTRPAEKHPARRFHPSRFLQIFVGSERQRLLATIGEGGQPGEGGTPTVNPEEKAAKNQLLIGAATLGVSLYAPGLFLVGMAGLLYQSKFILGEAYRGVVHEKRVNIYALTTAMIAGASLSGSFVALTLGVFSASFLRWLVAKTESAAQQSVAAAFLRQPRSVWMVVGDTELQVAFEKVALGDTIIVSAGEMIPVDGVITQGLASVDQHMLTGESQLVEKSPGDSVLASSMLLRGKAHIRVQHSGDDTVSAQIARALADTRVYKHEMRARTERQLDRMAFPILGLSAATIPIWGVNSALAILWTIPSYRLMFLGPLTMLSFMHILARNGILIKHGQALERLREVDTVILDKTGTLTLAQPIAGRIFCFAELPEEEVLALAAAAEHRQNHPIATAIVQLAHKRAVCPPPVQEAEVTVGFGVQVTVGTQKILVGSERLMATSQVALSAEAVCQQAEVHQLGNSLIFVARDDKLVGAIEICAALRPGAEELVAALRQRGKQVIILSGDQEAPTRTLAAQLGIERYFAQTLPQDKAKLVEQLQQEGRVICFVGDGINDSIALQRADVSVSMKGATSIATTVAQVVLMKDDLNQMVVLLDLADRFEEYMRLNRLSTNLPAFLVLGGTLAFGWSFLTAVLINQVTIPVALYSVVKPATEFAEATDSDPEHDPPGQSP